MALIPRGGSSSVEQEDIIVIHSDSCSEDDAELPPLCKIVKIEPEEDTVPNHE